MENDSLPPTKDFYCDFVLNNKIDAEKVRETERVLAYYHTKPNWTVHIVIIPKQHITRLVEVEDMSVIREIFEVTQEIIKEKVLLKVIIKSSQMVEVFRILNIFTSILFQEKQNDRSMNELKSYNILTIKTLP